MSFSQHFKSHKNKRVGQPWWPRKNKNSIVTADSSNAYMEQAVECSSNASAQCSIKKSLVSGSEYLYK